MKFWVGGPPATEIDRSVVKAGSNKSMCYTMLYDVICMTEMIV